MVHVGWLRGWAVVAVVLAGCAKPSAEAAKSADEVSSNGATDAGATNGTTEPGASGAVSGTSAGRAEDSTSAPTEPAGPPPRERIRLHNSCNTPVHFRIVRVHDSELQTSLTNGSSTEERASDGDEIRLMGEDNKVLATLTIQASMSGVDFSSSCSGIDAQ